LEKLLSARSLDLNSKDQRKRRQLNEGRGEDGVLGATLMETVSKVFGNVPRIRIRNSRSRRARKKKDRAGKEMGESNKKGRRRRRVNLKIWARK